MTTVAEVRLWGRTIGAVSLPEGASTAAFEYAGDFVGSGIEVAPVTMPLSRRVYMFPALARQTFHGLPGLLADALPDRFGNTLIDAWLATQGRRPESFNSVERLCYTGARAMGALEFAPAIGPEPGAGRQVDVDRLVALASEVLSHRDHLRVSFSGRQRADALAQILRVGTSAGGARAKAVIAWNPETNDVRSGQVEAGSGFEYWLLKFDGVTGNRDRELEDPRGYGVIEYAYYHMARDCGIDMSECRLFEENGRRHFMTRRFDRTADGGKLHMQSLCALGHFDYNLAGAYGYEQALLLMRQLGLSPRDIEQQFRRMVFNIVARNQDDHTKNIAFLMDRSGRWSLAPAFDLTWAYNPQGDWTASHQMTVNGKRDDFTLEDLNACARVGLLKRGRAGTILEEVLAVVDRWPDYARDVGVPAPARDRIGSTLRLSGFG